MSTDTPAALQRAAMLNEADLTKHWAVDGHGGRYTYWRCERCGDEHNRKWWLVRSCGCYDG